MIGGHALGFGPRFPRNGLVDRFRFFAVNLAGEFCVGQPLAADRANYDGELFRVVHFSVVKPAGLFIDVPEQVERLNADIGAVERPLRSYLFHRFQ
jgi:hypothetical protein